LRTQEVRFSEHQAWVTAALEAFGSRFDDVDFRLRGVLAAQRFQYVEGQSGIDFIGGKVENLSLRLTDIEAKLDSSLNRGELAPPLVPTLAHAELVEEWVEGQSGNDLFGSKVENLSLRLTDVEAKLDGFLNRGELAPPLVPTSAHAELVEELSKQILTIETRVASNEHGAQLFRQSLEQPVERLESIERELQHIQGRMGKQSLDDQTCVGCDELAVNKRKHEAVPISSRRRAVFLWLSYVDAFPRRPQRDDIEHLIANSRPMPPVHTWVSIVLTILAVCLLAGLSVYPSMKEFVHAVPTQTTREETGRPITIDSTAKMPYFWFEIPPTLGEGCTDCLDLVRVEVQQKSYLGNTSYRNLTFEPGPCPRARDMFSGRDANANITFVCPIDDEDTGELSGAPGSQPHRTIIVRILGRRDPQFNYNVDISEIEYHNEDLGISEIDDYISEIAKITNCLAAILVKVCWQVITVDFEGDLSNKFTHSSNANCVDFPSSNKEHVVFRYNAATMNSRYNPNAGIRELSWASYFTRESRDSRVEGVDLGPSLEFQLRSQALWHEVRYFSTMDFLVRVGGSWGAWIGAIGMLNLVVTHIILSIRGRLPGEDPFDDD